MRVCFLLHQGNMYSGGQGVYLSNLTRELAALGHEVHVIVGPPWPDTAPGVVVHRVKTFSVYRLLETGRFWFYGRDPLEAFQPLNFYELATSRMGMFSVMFAFSFRAYQAFRELAARLDFDLVHDVQVLGYGTLLTRALGLPVVANIHHPLAIDRRNSLLQARSVREKVRRIAFYPFWMQELVARRLDRIITGSLNSATSVGKAFSLPSHKIAVIHDGVDAEVYRPQDSVEKLPGSLLYVGNSEDRNKGARYLLEALHLLKGSLDFHLTLVDRPREALDLTPRLVEEFGLENRVTFSGRVSREELVRLYRRSELMVSPSLYEGFGLPAAEAMACGVPLVATTAGAFPEVIEDGATGLLVPPGDAPALADAIARLMNDAALRRRMGEAGRARIEEHFTWRQTALKTAALYEEVLGLSAAGAREAQSSAGGSIGVVTRARPIQKAT
jgi:glycosyltransferase involved in cell wall biosynthesis